MNGSVRALAIIGSDLYAGGEFTVAGAAAAQRVARWDGATWYPLGGGVDANVNALAVVGTDLYAGGAFAKAGAVTASRVAKWDGSTWSALGSGADGKSTHSRPAAPTSTQAGNSGRRRPVCASHREVGWPCLERAR